MQDTAHSALAGWESFYVIVGTSAAALTGLQFVVITLVTEKRSRSDNSAIDAFATPSVVHFCVGLLVSAVLSAPWPRLAGAGVVLAASGIGGVGYVAIVVRRTQRQTGYTPVAEDWVWHVALPAVAYLTILVSGLTLVRYPLEAMFAIGGATVLLLFVGIHNAWDTITYIVVTPDTVTNEGDRSAAAPAVTSTAAPSSRDPVTADDGHQFV